MILKGKFEPGMLIRILPSETDPNEQIQITLESHNLENADFDALSYTWGASTLEECEQSDAQIFTTVERCYPVLCCNKIILCTKSLRTALRRLRTYHDDVKARVFQHVTRRLKLALTWADGLCINQDDPDERATQVALMGTLYTKANQVLAFVGEFDAGAKTALDMVIRLNNISLRTWFYGIEDGLSRRGITCRVRKTSPAQRIVGMGHLPQSKLVSARLGLTGGGKQLPSDYGNLRAIPHSSHGSHQ